MKPIFSFGAALALATLAHSASAANNEVPLPSSLPKKSELAVYVNPAMIPDTGICHLFADRMSRIDFLFYSKGELKVTGLNESIFTLDIPEGLGLRSVALWAGWGHFGGKHYTFKTEKIERDGLKYTRYTVPLPGGPPLAKAVPVKGDGYGGPSNHQCKLFLEPRGQTPEKFKIYWEIKGEKLNAKGEFPTQLHRLQSKPPSLKRFSIHALAGQVRLPWNDLTEITHHADTLHDLGIRWVPSVNRATLINAGLPDVWSERGFRFTSLLYEPPVSGGDMTAPIPEADYLVGLDRESAKGQSPQRYGTRIFCPQALSTPGRSGFEEIKKRALSAAKDGAEMIDWDLETQTWSHCFCESCLNNFSKASGLSREQISALKPLELIRRYPLEWYFFRNEQTAAIYRQIRKSVQEVYPNAKISANSLLVRTNEVLKGLGPGFATFAEDPRLLDKDVDIHTIDTLTGSAADPVFINAVTAAVKKPVIGTAGCASSIGYSHNYIAGRRMRADEEGMTLGYDQRGKLQRLGMVAIVASGAVGVRIPIMLYNEPMDAEVAVETQNAVFDLEKLEDIYLDWPRSDDSITVTDITRKPSPWTADRSIIGGGPWKTYYDRYAGRVQYRAHYHNGKLLISLFNWDPHQEKTWLVRPKQINAEGGSVRDFLKDRQFVLEENQEQPHPAGWSAKQLEAGISVKIPPADYVVLELGGDAGAITATTILTTAEREADIVLAGKRAPAPSELGASGKEVDLWKDAEFRLERVRKHYPPEVFGER